MACGCCFNAAKVLCGYIATQGDVGSEGMAQGKRLMSYKLSPPLPYQGWPLSAASSRGRKKIHEHVGVSMGQY